MGGVSESAAIVPATPAAVGGPGGGLVAQSASLSDRVRVRFATAILEAGDAGRFDEAIRLLRVVARRSRDDRARIRAAHALLSFGAQVAEWSLPKGPLVSLETTGPTTIIFKSQLPEES